ncbi:Crp/Fnr family transcriptional regulator [Oceanithermus sp.]
MLPGRWSELPESLRAALEGRLEPARFRAGKTIYDRGDPARRLYVVAEGCVRLFRVDKNGREVTVGVIENGGLFGEEALLKEGSYQSYAETVSRSLLISIRREELEPLWRRYPLLRRHLLAELARRLRETQNFYAQLRFAEVLPRLARVLLKYMKPGREGIEVTLSHRQIGYLIGANRDTVTRALGELALADLLEINYRRLVILDPEALRRLAGEPVGAEDGGP